MSHLWRAHYDGSRMEKYFRGNPQRSCPDVLTVTRAVLVCVAGTGSTAGHTVAQVVTALVRNGAEGP